jgi:hypothetical protein
MSWMGQAIKFGVIDIINDIPIWSAWNIKWDSNMYCFDNYFTYFVVVLL